MATGDSRYVKTGVEVRINGDVEFRLNTGVEFRVTCMRPMTLREVNILRFMLENAVDQSAHILSPEVDADSSQPAPDAGNGDASPLSYEKWDKLPGGF